MDSVENVQPLFPFPNTKHTFQSSQVLRLNFKNFINMNMCEWNIGRAIECEIGGQGIHPVRMHFIFTNNYLIQIAFDQP